MFSNLAQTTYDDSWIYQTSGTSEVDSEASAGAMLAAVVIFLVLYLFFAWVTGKIFKKAGQKAWPAYVPVYNSWVLFQIAGRPGWWALIGLIPYLGSLIYLVLWIIASLDLSKRFGKSPVFAIFGLVIFSGIGYLILAFGKSTYNADATVASGQGTIPDSPYPTTPAQPAPTPAASQPTDQTPPQNPAQ